MKNLKAEEESWPHDLARSWNTVVSVYSGLIGDPACMWKKIVLSLRCLCPRFVSSSSTDLSVVSP